MAYVDERLELFGRLRAQAGGRSLQDALRLEGRALRFHVGTSLADLRVPVHVAPPLEGAFRAALRDLFFLLSVRHRPALRQNEYDRLLLLDGFDPRALRPVSFSAPSSVKSEGVRRAFLEAPELHPLLDSGVVASWISSGRPGRALVGVLAGLLRRAAEEGSSGDPQEPTPYIVLLALRRLGAGLQELARELPVGGSMGRALPAAVAAGLLVCLRLAMRESGALEQKTAASAEAATLALPWLSGTRLLWGSAAQMYGVAFAESLPGLDELVHRLASGATAEAIAREAAVGLSRSAEAEQKAARAVALAKLRADLLQLLRMIDAARASALAGEGPTVAQLFQLPSVLERSLAGSARKELLGRVKSSRKAATHEPARAALAGIEEQLEEWDGEDPGDAVPAEAAARAWAIAVAGLASDAAIDRALSQAESQLVHRTGGESEGGVETQYEGGALYLLSAAADRPILRQRARAPQMGHLFCDMKDFTKRTAFLKETVVADFLSREFYGPILTAAARHAHGAAHLADKGGIYLNNLLGDAVSFSGDIAALVELSHDIRRALDSYARRLASESSREQVSRTLSAVEGVFRARADELARAVRTAEDALRKGTLDPVSGDEPSHRLSILRAEQQRLEDERAREIALASGEKLEAGIFISYGAAPEVSTFEHHVFGQIKVSIAEKINESARGTARTAGVRARIDSLVQRARSTRGDSVVFPFSVAVSQPLAMPVQGETELAVRASLAAQDMEGAETLVAAAARDFVARLAAENHPEDRGDIYNGGAALSEEALGAYVEARRGSFEFLRREVPVRSLHPSLRDRFVFPGERLRVVMALSRTDGALLELYAWVGSALFKGFEKQGGLGIYEMIARENPLFMLLAAHHVPGWLRERAQGAAGTDWPGIDALGGELE